MVEAPIELPAALAGSAAISSIDRDASALE
jgi:hypothetical protein